MLKWLGVSFALIALFGVMYAAASLFSSRHDVVVGMAVAAIGVVGIRVVIFLSGSTRFYEWRNKR